MVIRTTVEVSAEEAPAVGHAVQQRCGEQADPVLEDDEQRLVEDDVPQALPEQRVRDAAHPVADADKRLIFRVDK